MSSYGGMRLKIGMVSLGCAKNRVDSENLLGRLVSAGHEIVSDPARADVLFVNTCGFIESAKKESIDAIFEMTQYKKDKVKLIVTGCLGKRSEVAQLDYKDAYMAKVVLDIHRKRRDNPWQRHHRPLRPRQPATARRD